MMPKNSEIIQPGGGPGPVSGFPHRWWVVPVVLVVLIGAIAALRLRTFDEPLERDLITYMLVGHAMNRGGQAYVDAWEIKPPGIYGVYALAEWAVGFGERQVYLLNVVAAALTLVGVYAAGSARGRAAGLWAAAFWALLCGAPGLQANQPNTEVFINAAVVGALALLLRAGDHAGAGVGRALAVGALFAVGTTFKQIVIIDALLLSCAHLAFAAGLPGGRRRALRDVAIFGAVGAACWSTLIGYFAATGRQEIFWVTNFSNARAYAGNPLFNIFRYVREGKILPDFLRFAAPVAGLVVLGLIRDRRSLKGRSWGLYLTALFAMQIKIPLNGMAFLPHYYQYWLPMLAVGAGWAAGARSAAPGRLASRVLPAAGAALVAFLLIHQGRYEILSADEWSRLKYGGLVIGGRDLGRAIGDVLRPDERLYQHGNKPELYYYSGHLPPSLLLWTAHLDDTWPAAPLLLGLHLAALAKAPPDLVVVEEPGPTGDLPAPERGLAYRLLVRSPPAPNEGRIARSVLDALLPSYRAATIDGLNSPGLRYHVRRGSPLDRRLGGEGPTDREPEAGRGTTSDPRPSPVRSP